MPTYKSIAPVFQLVWKTGMTAEQLVNALSHESVTRNKTPVSKHFQPKLVEFRHLNRVGRLRTAQKFIEHMKRESLKPGYYSMLDERGDVLEIYRYSKKTAGNSYYNPWADQPRWAGATREIIEVWLLNGGAYKFSETNPISKDDG